jgi:CHAT domain-containing protein
VLPQLRGARLEAERVAAIHRVQPLLRASATEPALRAAVGSGAGVLHLATHGTFDADHPLRSAIYLSGPDGKAAPLTAAELFENPIVARLVILSACETGIGRVTAGDDFLGLVRSFYLAGSRAVVNSLWPVEDQGARLFMETFHANLRDGRYGAAWTAARDAARAAGYPVSVYAAFVLGGSLEQ